MKPYPTYKDSGIEWIGEIPEHWGNYKISRSFKLIGSGTTPKADNEKFYNNGDINWILTGDLKDNIINESTKKITQEALDKHSTLKIYPKNTLLIAMYGATIGKVGILNIEACTNQACCALSQSDFFNIKFLYYWFVTNRNQIINLSYGGGQPNISQEIIKSLKISGPSLKEQNNIVSYLDDRVSQIDETIAKKEMLVELLEEERKAIINEAVTKGLNSNVKLKPSGIEWLGDIPEHWEIQKLKYVVSQRLQYGANEPAEDEDPDQPRYIRITDFGDDGSLKDDTFRSLTYEKAKEFMLNEGDVLFARSGATVGKTFHFKDYIGEACFAGYLIKASPDQNILTSDWLYNYTKSSYYERWRNSVFIQATIQNIGADKYNFLPVTIAPIKEQKDIVLFLEKQNSRIDNTITKIQKEIELLKEYRQALIFEAVTGKIDVREYN
ncbi:MAG TPA: restriction endonuclease subunit S [Bacteroidales bacterium]|nr:restriction endonuclease subunit S [Bacteroidales bacterium]